MKQDMLLLLQNRPNNRICIYDYMSIFPKYTVKIKNKVFETLYLK